VRIYDDDLVAKGYRAQTRLDAVGLVVSDDGCG